MITVKELKEFLNTCPEEAIVKVTGRMDTDGPPVEAESMSLYKNGKYIAIEDKWDY